MLRARSLGTLAIVLLAWSGPAFGDTVRHQIDGVRGDVRANVARYLETIRFDGETPLTPTQIEQRYAEAAAGIATAIEPFGYYQPTITGRLTTDNEGAWVAHFQVEPGSPVRVRRLGVNVSGPGADDPTILAAWNEFPLEIGDPFSHLAYEEGKQRLEDAATRRGYLEAWFAEHEVVVDPASGSAAIALDFATGRRFRFGELLVEQAILAPELFVNFTTFEPGEPFSYRPLLDMQRALLDSGYFERVEVEALPQLEGPIPPLDVAVSMTLVAARPQRYSAGIGYRTDIRARGSLGVELRRLNRWGHRFHAELQISDVESFGLAQLTLPDPRRPSTDRVVLEAGYSDADPDTSESTTSIAGVSFLRARAKRQESASLRYRIDDFTIGPQDGDSEFLLISGSETQIHRDDPIFTREGSRLHLEATLAAESVGSDADLLRVVAGGKWIDSLAESWRLLYRVELGYLNTSEFRALPPSLRFFTGGDQSIRGFGYQDVGPIDESGVTPGGDAMAVASVELEYRIFDRWAAAVFVDGGDAFFADNVPDAGELKVGAGVGARWLSPIGMVRVDVAMAISEPGNPIRFHFSIGPDL